jgi:Fe2+ transport system protein FeoA
MSCRLLAFVSDLVPLSSLPVGAHAIVSSVAYTSSPRVEHLLSLGVLPGTLVRMVQRFPGVVFLCDQTELAIERGVADAILVRPMEDLR